MYQPSLHIQNFRAAFNRSFMGWHPARIRSRSWPRRSKHGTRRREKVRHIDHPMAAGILNEFQGAFDTHAIEKRILRLHTEAFARELLEYSQRGPDALTQFSAQFGRWIDREFQGQITQTQKVVSANLAGDSVSNQQWRRSNPSQPIT